MELQMYLKCTLRCTQLHTQNVRCAPTTLFSNNQIITIIIIMIIKGVKKSTWKIWWWKAVPLKSMMHRNSYFKPKLNSNAICRPPTISSFTERRTPSISLANHHAIILIQVSFIFRSPFPIQHLSPIPHLSHLLYCQTSKESLYVHPHMSPTLAINYFFSNV